MKKLSKPNHRTYLQMLCWLTMLVSSEVVLSADSGYQGLLLEPAKDIKRHQLIDHHGHDFTFPQKNEKLKLAFFGYVSCPDVCPLAMHKVISVIKGLGDVSDNVEYVFISIDNDRDSPQLLKDFVKYYHPSIIGLTGGPHSIKAIENDFGILTRKFQGKTAFAYTMEHSVFMYLIDKQGKLKLMYPASASPKQIVTDVHKLLRADMEKTAKK